MGNTALKDRKHYCNGNSVVRTERGSVRTEKVSRENELDRIACEVVDCVSVRLAYHVKVSLEHDRIAVFVALRGTCGNENVTRSINICLVTE